MRPTLVGALMLALVATMVPVVSAPAQTLRQGLEGCYRPDPPRRFQRQVRTAIRISRDLPREWADAPEIAKIVCWQGSGFRTDFRKVGGARFVWRGLSAMTVEEMQTIFGTWMTADRDALRLRSTCFEWGWASCANTIANAAWASTRDGCDRSVSVPQPGMSGRPPRGGAPVRGGTVRALSVREGGWMTSFSERSRRARSGSSCSAVRPVPGRAPLRRS